MKKLFSVILACVLCLSLGSSVFAADNPTSDYTWVNGQKVLWSDLDNYNEGTIHIYPSRERIDSKGKFTFEIHDILTSDSFKVSSNQIEITLKAHIENNVGTDLTGNYPSHKYTIALYQKGLFGSKISSTSYYADYGSNTWKVVGLDTSKTYYFTITNTDYLPNGVYVVGNGSVSNFAGTV